MLSSPYPTQLLAYNGFWWRPAAPHWETFSPSRGIRLGGGGRAAFGKFTLPGSWQLRMPPNCVRETVKTSLPHSSSPEVNWWGICVRRDGVKGCTPPLPRPPCGCTLLFSRPPPPSRGGQCACASPQPHAPPPPRLHPGTFALPGEPPHNFFSPGKVKSRRGRARALRGNIVPPVPLPRPAPLAGEGGGRRKGGARGRGGGSGRGGWGGKRAGAAGEGLPQSQFGGK